MEFARNLRERRGLTQAELAEKIGCHATTVSQIESARMLPSLELFARLVRELKVSATRLLEELLTAYETARRAPTAASVSDLHQEREKRRKPIPHFPRCE